MVTTDKDLLNEVLARLMLIETLLERIESVLVEATEREEDEDDGEPTSKA